MPEPALEPRPEVAALPPCVHGAVGDAELRRLGLTPADALDFSVNVNPLGPAPDVRRALASLDPARYPDGAATALREALASQFRVSYDQVLAGNGSAELIWLLALAYLRPGDTCAIFGPTFGEYERAARLMGASVYHYTATVETNFALGIAAAGAWLARLQPRIAILCNPNNPTGTYLNRPQIAALVEAAPRTLFAIDEAYGAFVRDGVCEGSLDALQALLELVETGRVLLLRSMTKEYALAGLRLGYAIAPAPVIDALSRAQPPWSINAAAQAAGLAAWQDKGHLRRARQVVQEAVDYLQFHLAALGYHVYPTAANFFLVEVGNAPALRQTLLPLGVVVRDCSSFGLPSLIRLAARPLPDCERLIQAMALRR